MFLGRLGAWIVVLLLLGPGCIVSMARSDRDRDGTVDGTGLCGNNLVEAQEECDGSDLGGATCAQAAGHAQGVLACAADCTFDESECYTCGDGLVGGPEECDDASDNSDVTPDACRSDCTNPRCGDGVIDTGESCDDGNTVSGDTCPADCQSSCGDNLVDPGEECDDGAANSDSQPDACRTDCRNAWCGDGVVDTGDECDDGAANSDTAPDACRTDCSNAQCGDGVVDTGEACDDGDTVTGDGCEATCQFSFLCYAQTHDTVRYVFCEAAAPWSNAEDICVHLGGHLATMSDAAENQWVWETATAYSAACWWIGYNDQAVEGTWEWVDGSAPGFEGWNAGEPNNIGEEDCACLYHGSTTNGWWDHLCGATHPFVCELQ